MSYIPGKVPKDLESLAKFLQEELHQIRLRFAEVPEERLIKTYVAPAKPYDGMKRYADGTQWNPGAGEGEYIYYAGAWHKCG